MENVTNEKALKFFKFAVKFKEEKIKRKAIQALATNFKSNLEYLLDFNFVEVKDLMLQCKESKVNQHKETVTYCKQHSFFHDHPKILSSTPKRTAEELSKLVKLAT